MTTAVSTTHKKTKTAHSAAQNASWNMDNHMDGQIAMMAYFKAESRGFEPGHELEDWLEAEMELMSDQQKH